MRNLLARIKFAVFGVGEWPVPNTLVILVFLGIFIAISLGVIGFFCFVKNVLS